MTSILRSLMLKPSTILFLVLGVSLVVLAMSTLRNDPGYVLLSVGGYAIESSFIVVAFVLLISGMLAFWGVRAVEWMFNAKRGQNRARKRTTKGLIALAEGNWGNAEKLLAKAALRHEVPLINYVTAAQAAHEQGEEDRRDEYLKMAHETTKGVDVAIGLTKARLQFDSKQWEQALATLMMLKQKDKSPSYPYVIKMLAEVYVQLDDWGNLKDLLPELKKRKLFAKEKYQELAIKCYAGTLKDCARKGTASEKAQALLKAWQETPKKLKTESLLIQTYCQNLMEFGHQAEAESVLQNVLNKSWDDNLVRLYGLVEGEDLNQQLLTAESWLKDQSNNAMLFLTLGRLCLQNKDWEKAQNYFESSLRSRNTAEAYGELGRLLSHMGQHQASNDYFQKGLAMISQRLPELPMPADRAAA